MSHPRPKANGMTLRRNRQCRTTWTRTLLAKAHGCGHRSQETGFDSLLPHDDASGNAPDILRCLARVGQRSRQGMDGRQPECRAHGDDCIVTLRRKGGSTPPAYAER